MEEIEVNRFEVIDHTKNGEGRVYHNYGDIKIEFSLQDDGKTLKIFITDQKLV